jgi:hypothetical protein
MIIKRKGFGKELNKYFGNLFAGYCEEFVPYKYGDLLHGVSVHAYDDHATITYSMPYAGVQYTGDNGKSGTGDMGQMYNPGDPWKRTLSPNPKATSYWDKYCWQQYKGVIGRQLNEKRKELSE